MGKAWIFRRNRRLVGLVGLVGNRHSLANPPEIKYAVYVVVVHEIHGAS